MTLSWRIPANYHPPGAKASDSGSHRGGGSGTRERLEAAHAGMTAFRHDCGLVPDVVCVSISVRSRREKDNILW